MNGTDGNDTLIGTRFDDILQGLDGDDIIKAKGGNDAISGGAGADRLYGQGGNDNIHGGEGNDRLYGGWGNDVLDGADGNDRLWGGAGNDIMAGGAGDDRLKGQDGNDTLFGGAGTDWALYSGGFDAFSVILRANGDIELTDTVGTEGVDTLSGIEKFRFGRTNMTLEDVLVDATREFLGSSLSERIDGTDGNDIIDGLSGNDVLSGGAGDDQIIGGYGNDRLYGGYGSDALFGGQGDDTLSAYDGNNIFDGGIGTDTLFLNYYVDLSTSQLIDIEIIRGSAGDDIIDLSGYSEGFIVSGNSGEDRIFSSKGDDTIDGTAEYTLSATDDDTLVYSGNRDDYTVEIADNGVLTITDTRADGDGVDTVSNIGTFEFADVTMNVRTLIGAVDGAASGLSEEIYGTEGNDTIDALGGDDLVYGGAGNDSLSGGAGRDFVFGEDGDDTLSGGMGEDTLVGGYGNDTAVFSGNLDDYLLFVDDFNPGTTPGEAGTINLQDTVEGRDGLTTIAEIETIVFADQTITFDELYAIPTEGDDVLSGTAGDDQIDGLGGDDVINGGDGNDELYGGSGNDTLLGGIGSNILDGGDGTDTAVFGGLITEYEIDEVEPGIFSFYRIEAYNSSAYGNYGATEATALIDIEFVEFADVTVAIGELPKFSTNSDDDLFGTYADDVIEGYSGNDNINAKAGNDYIDGGDGDDRITGGTGNDEIIGGTGADTFVFGPYSGEDYIADYEAGIDKIELAGLTLNDVGIFDYGGSVIIDGGAPDLDGRTTTTIIIEGATVEQVEADLIFSALDPSQQPPVATEGDDILIGTDAGEEIDGLSGNDTITGGAGNDTLYGGDGDDRLSGGTGDDTMEGNAGADTFVFRAAFGFDLVHNYEAGIDRIEVRGLDADDVIVVDNYDGATLETLEYDNTGTPLSSVLFYDRTAAEIEADLFFV